jgi:hypothetical protein
VSATTAWEIGIKHMDFREAGYRLLENRPEHAVATEDG